MNNKIEPENLDGIELLIRDLNNTRLKFGQMKLHKENNGRCSYCAEGVLMVKSGVDKNLLTNRINLYDTEDNEMIDHLFYNRYGVHLLKMYEKNIICQICNRHSGLLCLEEVINHFNDQHSLRHKDVAMYLKEINSNYSLVTGQEREKKKDINEPDMPRI